MITFLEGVVVEKQPTTVILNVGGVGYEVRIPLSSYDRLPAVNAVCHILTYDHVREDDHILFGFMTEDERRMFVLLMTVSGIGPKLALSALSGLTVRELKRAIVERDAKRLSAVPGIGKKTAERIGVELHDKIGQAEAWEAVAGAAPLAGKDGIIRDTLQALVALGYKRVEAEQMVKRALEHAPADAGVEALVRKALSG